MNNQQVIANLRTIKTLVDSTLMQLEGNGPAEKEPELKPVTFSPVQASQNYNTKNIRTLLMKGFGIPELLRFCTDNPKFRPVKDTLAGLSGKETVVTNLMEYSERNLLLPTLLGWAEAVNPGQYENCGPY